MTMQKNKAIDWLLETQDAGVRYLAMRDLDLGPGGGLQAAKENAHREGPIAHVLGMMDNEGYWVKPGPGYNPKYTGTAWSLILLSQLGGSIGMDKRIASACSYVLQHSLAEGGRFSINGLASGTIDCLQGNLCAALTDLEAEGPGIDQAFEWMARSVTGDGVAQSSDKSAPLRYYAYKCGPVFACGANNKLPCAWGAVKVMLAFSKLPDHKKTPLIQKAIDTGVDFLLSRDPARADYPCRTGNKPSRDWWQFGFPVFYITDLLQNAEALVGLGYGNDPRLHNALGFIREKQDNLGRWPLDYDYPGKTWLDFGVKKQPNKWVTVRALRVLNMLNL